MLCPETGNPAGDIAIVISSLFSGRRQWRPRNLCIPWQTWQRLSSRHSTRLSGLWDDSVWYCDDVEELARLGYIWTQLLQAAGVLVTTALAVSPVSVTSAPHESHLLPRSDVQVEVAALQQGMAQVIEAGPSPGWAPLVVVTVVHSVICKVKELYLVQRIKGWWYLESFQKDNLITSRLQSHLLSTLPR